MMTTSVPLDPFHSMTCHARPCQKTPMESLTGPPSKLVVVDTKGPRAQMSQQPCFCDTVPQASRQEARKSSRGPWAVAHGNREMFAAPGLHGMWALWIEFVVFCGKRFLGLQMAARDKYTVVAEPSHANSKETGVCSGRSGRCRGRAAVRLQLPTQAASLPDDRFRQPDCATHTDTERGVIHCFRASRGEKSRRREGGPASPYPYISSATQGGTYCTVPGPLPVGTVRRVLGHCQGT